MNYEEALKYKNNHTDLLGTENQLSVFKYKISNMHIVPAGLDYSERQNAYGLNNIDTGADNYEVYITGGTYNRRYDYLLSDYLSEIAQ